MKKLLTATLFSILSSQAFAEWTLIQTSDNGTMSINLDSLQRSGDLVTISTLHDYVELQEKGEMSSQWTELHDCKKKKFKALAINYFSDNMGRGQLIQQLQFNEEETAWSDIVLYSVGELKANIICSR